jgi:hypothetical protein
MGQPCALAEDGVVVGLLVIYVLIEELLIALLPVVLITVV